MSPAAAARKALEGALALHGAGPPDARPSPHLRARAESALMLAAARVRLLGAVAPRGAEVERARLVAEFEAGRETTPRWTYAPEDHAALAGALDALATDLDARRADDPLLELYAARAAEIALEARIASAAGTPELARLARARFDPEPEDAARARALARVWIGRTTAPPAGPPCTTDGPEPESLVSRMRSAIGRAGAPFVVEVRSGLVSLAATGERAVFVAARRIVDDEDVRRTVLHEVEAHVLPRARAATLVPRIFRIGTARGTDDQEGLALVFEERAGFLGSRRARELAVRHLATVAMDDGASFVECVRALARDHGLPVRDAVLVAERAYRGGDGTRGGLGRERVYLAAYARVREHLAARPEDEVCLASGQVSVAALARLRSLVTSPPAACQLL